MTPIVEIAGVTRAFAPGGRTLEALGPFDLAVEPAEFVSLVGPSGCGKSTLLNVVAGLLAPTSGEVRVNGRRVRRTPDEVGMMFQSPVLLDWRSARSNVLLPIEIAGGRRSVAAARGRAEELLELVGLAGFEDRYPWELSGGMQQRVAICRMLIADPQVLLLDEPFGALDELTRERMNVELERIFSSSPKAAIFVTHNIAEAVFLSDRVVVMTPRPGRAAGIVEVPFPRPREPEMTTSPEFNELVRAIRALLHEPVETAAAPEAA